MKKKVVIGPVYSNKPKRVYQINNRETTNSINPVFLGEAISPRHNKRFF